MFTKKATLSTSLFGAAFLFAAASCSGDSNPPADTDDDDDVQVGDDDDDTTTTPTEDPDDDDDDNDDNDDDETTSGDDDDDGNPNSIACGDLDQGCYAIDLLFVIDNSGSMAEEQKNLADNFALLVEQLNLLTDNAGKPVPVNLNVYVTSTDMDHPRCAETRPEDVSDPPLGMAVTSACVDRLPDFIFKESETSTLDKQQICQDFCPSSGLVPEGSSVLNWTIQGSNLEEFADKFKDAAEAKQALTDSFGCLGLQGIGGCGYEGTLEAMMQALNPDAPHNKGSQPFIRDGATLAVVIMTDEEDCSVLAPDGYLHWSADTAENQDHKFWARDAMDKPVQSSAICWNGGVKCSGDDGAGAYEKCVSEDKGVLHPISRYKKVLNEYWGHKGMKKDVLMLGILGVPEVTKHDDKTHLPTEGGVLALKYNKNWQASDIPEGVADTPAALDIGFGIGKGCASKKTGVAVPPVRVKEVCESLNYEENGLNKTRCCIESICDDNYSDAIKCLAGLIVDIPPIE